MGMAIARERFQPEDYERFAERLVECVAALGELLRRPGFGEGPRTLGAELELFLVDEHGYARPVNLPVLEQTRDERLTVELARFNLECNLRPCVFSRRPFTALGAECHSALAEARRAAATHSARVVITGILPTLREEDVVSEAMTPLPRFRALSASFRKDRRKPPESRLEGEESLRIRWEDVSLGGACTSMQYHLRVGPGEFARVYNAAQLATAVALAVGANSPVLLGHRVWDETRVAFYGGFGEEGAWEGGGEGPRPSRACLGRGWVRQGVWELFAESVALHTPLLPVVGPQSPLAVVAEGGVPRLDELRLHHGTVWAWNRAVYDPAAGGHVRIEFRALPAGPTVVDMLANGALLLGLTLGLAGRVEALLPGMPFRHALDNFMQAARWGLDAVLLWPAGQAPSPRPVPVGSLVESLLPVAWAGLVGAGVESSEAEALLRVVEGRLRTRRTGARWQRQMLARLETLMPRPQALQALLARYAALSESGVPVHEWPVDT